MIRDRFCRFMTLGLLGFTVVLIVAGVASAQGGAPPDAAGTAVKLGIAPFADATASGNRTAGVDVARTLQSEVVHSTSLRPRVLAADGATKDAETEPEKAVALGRSQHLDLIFIGTVLEAGSEESSKSDRIPSFKGQSGNVTLHRVKATVTEPDPIWWTG
jgi:hypothetical protein